MASSERSSTFSMENFATQDARERARTEQARQHIAKQIVHEAEIKGRPVARGRFLFTGDTKLYIRGVTYGTFRPDSVGREYPSFPRLESDFIHIAASGFNAIRTYTVPPRHVLDAAF